MDSVSFFINGLPTPKGSLTRMPNGAMVPAGTRASRDRMNAWRDDVRSASLDAMGTTDVWNGPVRLLADFLMPYPTSSIRKYQFGWVGHTKKPDIDKLCRALLDPMKGIIWRDDSQVCFAWVNKSYAWDGRIGARVIVDFLDDDFMKAYAESRCAITDVIKSL